MVTLSVEQHKQFQRIAQQIRCPTCTAQSVYESDTQESILIRQEIERAVSLGYDDAQILVRLDKARHDQLVDQTIGPIVFVSIAIVLLISHLVRDKLYLFNCFQGKSSRK